jgi:hypothetical protein
MMKGLLFVSLLVMESCAVWEPEEVGVKETEKVVDAPGARESVVGVVRMKCEVSAPDFRTAIASAEGVGANPRTSLQSFS